MGTISCSAQPTPAPAADAPGDPSEAPVPETTIAEVRLVPQRSGPSLRWRDEMLGIATASLEAGLSDLEDVIPVVEGVPPSPGLDGALRSGRRVWSAAVQVAPAAEGVRFELSLCDPRGACADYASTGPREHPERALAELLRETAHALGRPVPAATGAGWDAPISHDPYAILLAGRSAATWYGLIEAVPDDLVGDKRRDIVTRAVLVDPKLAFTQWINARRALQRGYPQLARGGFTRASLAQPQRVLFRADEAAAVRAMGLEEEARRAWDLVQAKAPDDLRFVASRARSMVDTREFDDAAELLEGLPERYENDVAVIELWVAISEAGGKAPPYDGLLARWQFADGTDPEPVRRRIALRVREERYDEAMAFIRTLEERGAREEASRLAMSLGVATGDYALAAKKAEDLGLAATASRIRAREALLRAPAEVPPELAAADEPVEFVARGGARLRAGKAPAALADADAALAKDPWMPEALALRMEALQQLGRTDDARRTARQLRAADPAWPIDRPVLEGTPRLQVQARTD